MCNVCNRNTATIKSAVFVYSEHLHQIHVHVIIFTSTEYDPLYYLRKLVVIYRLN